MIKRTILLSVSLSLSLTLLSCSKSTTVADGVEAKAEKIERASHISMGSAGATARQGFDIARVFFELKAASNVKELKLSTNEQQLIDTDGKSYTANADLSFTFGAGGGTMSMDSMFEVPKGATLKTFKLGRATLDLTGVNGAKPVDSR